MYTGHNNLTTTVQLFCYNITTMKFCSYTIEKYIRSKDMSYNADLTQHQNNVKHVNKMFLSFILGGKFNVLHVSQGKNIKHNDLYVL